MDIFKMEIAKIIRNSTHNMSITEPNELDNEIYFDRIRYFIEMLEGRRNDAYLDGIVDSAKPSRFISAKKFYSLDKVIQEQLKAECFTKTGKTPITTIGIGTNIESDAILNKLDKLLQQPGLMNQVYFGQNNLTDEQIDIIFRDSMVTRLEELKKIYGSDWDKLRANERIVILSLYFNGPKLAGTDTDFRKHIKNYVATNDQKYLELAVDEVLNRSNKDKLRSVQNRREAEARLLASYYSPTYTKPNESVNASKITTAKINETIIPLHNDSSKQGNNSEYFIWRTKMDPKVRAEHALLEGKIFRKDSPPKFSPGSMHNCRCHVEEVPDYILVDDEVAKRMAFELYMRKGIKHRMLLIA